MMTWEQAVQKYIKSGVGVAEIESCYFDQPILKAAQRFYQSNEWQAVQEIFGSMRGDALDIGAGRGIATYALAVDGWQVTALEPDASTLVGHKAIEQLAESSGYSFNIVAEFGESLPFSENKFDLVYGRAVLHHAKSLEQLCLEVNRVLKPGGQFLFVREHVIAKPEDKSIFLNNHPLHRYYGGENAYLLNEYKSVLVNAGLNLKRVFNPFESEINTFPQTIQEVKQGIADKVRLPIGRLIPDVCLSLLGKVYNRPGCLYAFYGIKDGK